MPKITETDRNSIKKTPKPRTALGGGTTTPPSQRDRDGENETLRATDPTEH